MSATAGRSFADNDQPRPPYDGHLLIADKSAWCRTDRLPPAETADWLDALRGGQIVTCAVVKLELLFSAMSSRDFDEIQDEQDALRDIPITRAVCRTALASVREIAYSGQFTRISPPDALIAAAAYHVPGVGVLHYDHHYERLAAVLNIPCHWIAAPGTVE
jgi:predicted nucleic acid-binding protein